MDVPQSWLVRPREAQHDLDNLQLGHLQADEKVEAVFELDYLVVEGHAREPVSNAPPRGVQLELINGAGVAVDDTQVVANLGYVQFKATPGVFHLRIREGRGRDIFRMESVGNEGWNSATVDVIGDEITVTDFEGLTIYPRLARLPGMEAEDVLQEQLEEEEEDEKPSGVLEKLLSK
jgi:UDP-glucose:glycoprotein glucosyltransferase